MDSGRLSRPKARRPARQTISRYEEDEVRRGTGTQLVS